MIITLDMIMKKYLIYLQKPFKLMKIKINNN